MPGKAGTRLMWERIHNGYTPALLVTSVNPPRPESAASPQCCGLRAEALPKHRLVVYAEEYI